MKAGGCVRVSGSRDPRRECEEEFFEEYKRKFLV